MPYYHDEVQRAEAEIKKSLPHVFIEKSDKGFGLKVYTPSIGETVVYQREPEIRAVVDDVIAKYRPSLPMNTR